MQDNIGVYIIYNYIICINDNELIDGTCMLKFCSLPYCSVLCTHTCNPAVNYAITDSSVP